MMFDDESPFRKKVYRACQCIPEGRVTTYKHLAQAIDCNSSQAVGQALRNNPYAPEVPCHRVIKTNRRLGGFYGQVEGEAVLKKKNLLQQEGVIFDNDDRINKACIFTF